MQRVKLFLIASLATPLWMAAVLAQGEDGRKTRDVIQIRVLCGQPVGGGSDLTLMQGGEVMHELGLVPSMVSDPLGVRRGELVLARRQAGEDKPDPLLTVRIPDAGKRFALALFPASEDDAAPYHHLLIRTDGVRFGASDLYLFNFTRIPIGGSLGSSNFTLAPEKSQVVTPKPAGTDRMYQARFYHEHEGQPRLFSDSRWPLAATARVYIFFIPDPQRQTISYVSFREYAPFD
jgi:hypothetical protein